MHTYTNFVGFTLLRAELASSEIRHLPAKLFVAVALTYPVVTPRQAHFGHWTAMIYHISAILACHVDKRDPRLFSA